MSRPLHGSSIMEEHMRAMAARVPTHSSGLVLSRLRAVLLESGYDPSAIDWNGCSGNSLTIAGPDQRYRITITPAGGAQ